MELLYDELALTDAGFIANFYAADNGDWFQFKQKITGERGDTGTINVEIMAQLKY